MAITANDIFTRAIALIDEINPITGTVDVDTTEDYKARAPYLIDILQKELAKTSKYTKVYEFEYTPADEQEWLKIDLPTDIDSLVKVVIEDNPDERINYQLEDDAIYIKYKEAATFRLVYNAIPPTVTALEDELVLDEITLNAMCYGLAKKFVEVEQNDFLVNLFTREYEKHSAFSSKPKATGIEKITNVYGRI